MNTFTDEQLAKLAARDDREALETLVARHLRPVYGFVYKYARDRESAEDLAQEIFVKVWRNLKSFDTQKKFRPWLYQIAKNTCLDFLKKKNLALPFSSLNLEDGEWLAQNLADTSASAEILTDRALLADKLAWAVKQLAPKSAQIISLYHQRDLSLKQIAGLVSQPFNTVKSRYRRAIIQLKNILKTRP